MHGFRKACLIALASVVGLTAVLVATWAIDSRTVDGKVQRNVELAGLPVGGKTAPELQAIVADVATKYRTSPVEIEADGGGFTTDAAALGLTLDPTATVESVMQVGPNGALPERVIAWARAFLSDRPAHVRVKVDEAAVYRVVAEKDPGPRTAPVEPSLKAKSNGTGFTVVDGESGKGIDAADVIDALPTAAASGGPVKVKVDRGEVAPRFSTGDVEALRKEAERATAKPMKVSAGAATATVPVATLRSWVHSEPADEGLRPDIDAKKSATDLAKLLARAATPPTQTSFVLSGGVPVAQPGRPGTACCGEQAPALIREALFGETPTTGAIHLPLKPVQPDITPDEIPALGVKELVGTFTTRYSAGQPRVTNIHRMSDMVKGTLIRPGETFSLNGKVGPRTLAKGYVVDRQINDKGEFDDAVGGGVSQFATTAFNAAFFAGLDYGEYQSHTIYINRYPYGREATVSWQHPDLQIKNTTPYGVVIWASYTTTSVTVSLYSTKHFASVVQSSQTKAPFGPGCTKVVTERKRTYLDGRTKVDTVGALYQPEEGKKCR